MFNIDKKSVINNEMNTGNYINYTKELLCFYINSGFAKSVYIDEDGELSINLDYDYILNTNFHEKITDRQSFIAINLLRYLLATYDDFINESDRLYLKSIGYTDYWDDVIAGVDVPIECCLYDYFQLLLCTSKHLECIGVPSEKVSNINKKLMRKGFSLRPNNNIKGLDIHYDNIKNLSPSDIKIKKEELETKKKVLKKELAKVQLEITLLERTDK